MDDRQIRDEAITIFQASYDNISTTLAWAFFLLAQNPHVYAKLRDESDTILPSLQQPYNNTTKLPYADQVIKETLRLYPSAPFLVRQAATNFVLVGAIALGRAGR